MTYTEKYYIQGKLDGLKIYDLATDLEIWNCPWGDLGYSVDSPTVFVLFSLTRPSHSFIVQLNLAYSTKTIKYSDEQTILELIKTKIKENAVVDLTPNDLGRDAWGRQKVVKDTSIIHGMFTFNVPVTTWYEEDNEVPQTSFVGASSVNGKLVFSSLGSKRYLRTFRNPRYQPNRGLLYSSSHILPNPTADGERLFGVFTHQSGAFFKLTSVGLYAVVRTTIDGVTTDDEYLIDTTGLDLSKGNIYDIQLQWRGVGNYKFLINLIEYKVIEYLGKRTELTMFNPANPIAFQCENLGDDVEIHTGCVDVTSEGGDDNGKTYGAIGTETTTGSVSITGYNVPILAVRSKKLVGSLINTRDTLALLASAYGDNRAVFRIWNTRDWTAITENNQTWKDYGDGHLEYIIYDTPDVTTPMTFNTAKATLTFGCRVDQDVTYSTSALFEGRTDVWMTPSDMLVFTLHRETGAGMLGGVTFEFAEEI